MTLVGGQEVHRCLELETHKADITAVRQAVLRKTIQRLPLYRSLQALRPAGAKGNVYSSTRPKMTHLPGGGGGAPPQRCRAARCARRTATSSAPSTAAAAMQPAAGGPTARGPTARAPAAPPVPGRCTARRGCRSRLPSPLGQRRDLPRLAGGPAGRARSPLAASATSPGSPLHMW